jgi:hypothetical protein
MSAVCRILHVADWHDHRRAIALRGSIEYGSTQLTKGQVEGGE